MNPLRSVIVGTAGHIDHGKSTLVEALTGTHPDRLEEEKRRGITIDLGFAFLEEGGVRFGFVDVPGHERFVKKYAGRRVGSGCAAAGDCRGRSDQATNSRTF